VQMFGYEPVAADYQYRRIIREMSRFHETWNVQGKASAPSLSSDGFVAHWTIETWGPNWSVATDFYFLRWDDMVAADAIVSDWRRVPLGIAALMEFIFTGTVIKYFTVAWRYGVFFIFPLVAIGGIIWLSIALSWSALISIGLPHPLLLAPAAALAVFVLLWWMVGRRLNVRYALDDWCFARDVVHRSRPELEARVDRLAREIVQLARKADVDEIVIDGHSLGAPLSLMVVDRALQLDAKLGGHGKLIHLVSSGSSLLKLALHPSAVWLRDAVGRVANAPTIYWVEFQAAADFINVYNVDPVVALGMPPAGKPIVKFISIPLMLEEATYKRFRHNFLRIHRQARMGNERRYYYDYYMLCCGPLAVTDWVENSDQSVAAFTADGALVEAASKTMDLLISGREPNL